MNQLPPVTSTVGKLFMRCPWCRAEMDDATIRLGDLQHAWEDADPSWPERTPDGEGAGALVVECPTCNRPAMVALAGQMAPSATRFVKLVPVRSEADLRLIRRCA